MHRVALFAAGRGPAPRHLPPHLRKPVDPDDMKEGVDEAAPEPETDIAPPPVDVQTDVDLGGDSGALHKE